MKKLGTLILGAILTLGIGAGISFKPNTDVVMAEEQSVQINLAATTGTLGESYESISWTNAGITFTNHKGGTAIRTSDTDHYRCYQNSTIVISSTVGNLTKIEFTCTSSSYATALSNSIKDGTKSTSGSSVTWTLAVGVATTPTVTLGAQSRLNKVVCYYTETTGEVKTPVDITATKVNPEKLWYVDDTITNDDINVYTVDEEGNNISKVDSNDFTIQNPKIVSSEHTITIVYEDFNTTLTFDASTIEESNYQLLTDVSNLVVNSKVIIAAADSDVAMSTTQNSNNRGQAEIKKINNSLVEPDETVQVFTLEAGTATGTYAFNTGSGYIYAASSTSNHLKTENEITDNSSFSITITEGVTSIVATDSSNRNVMQYNESSKLFSCYSSASQKAVCIYYIAPIQGLVSTIDLDVENGVYTKNSEVQINATVNEDALNKTLAYTSSNEAVATVSDTGLIRFVGIGSSTITVSSTDGSEISKSINVVCTNNDGLTVDTAFTAEEAVVVATLYASNSETEYFVKDTMTKIDTEYSSEHGNISITLGGAFKLYRMTITAEQANNLVVGDIVTAKGHIVNYGGHTPEFAQGCELLSIEYTATSVAARIKVLAGGWDNRVTTENCYNNYAAANELVLALALSAEELETFKTSTDTEIANARTTYEHWCFVNGAEAYEETVPAGSRLSAFNNSSNMIIIVVAISSLVILATAGLLISRKRRYSK